MIAGLTNDLNTFMSDIDLFALKLSALGHDLGHPGVGNGFMINSKHNLALRYNDISVLENFHAATLFEILNLSGCNILDNFPQ